jgi:hypothetical protein
VQVELRTAGGVTKLQQEDTALAETIKDNVLGHAVSNVPRVPVKMTCRFSWALSLPQIHRAGMPQDFDVVGAAARALGALGAPPRHEVQCMVCVCGGRGHSSRWPLLQVSATAGSSSPFSMYSTKVTATLSATWRR